MPGFPKVKSLSAEWIHLVWLVHMPLNTKAPGSIQLVIMLTETRKVHFDNKLYGNLF